MPSCHPTALSSHSFQLPLRCPIHEPNLPLACSPALATQFCVVGVCLFVHETLHSSMALIHSLRSARVCWHSACYIVDKMLSSAVSRLA